MNYRQEPKDWHSIAQYVGKEIYLVAGGEDEETGDVHAFETWGDLIEHLKTLTPIVDQETRVFHGILTVGEIIPSSFRGKSAFIICLDPYEDLKGNVVESTDGSPAGLAGEIKNIMNLGGPISDARIGIDDIFVLYGYQIETCLSVNDDDLDEEIIATCREIAVETEVARTLIECA